MKKGFTLIELLGVLTVLAIISFIAVPIIINIINDSRDKALERSLEGYIKAVNTTIAQKSRESTFENAICTIESNGNLNCDDEVYEISAKNIDNISGTVLILNYAVVAYSKVNIKGKEFSKSLDNVVRILPGENDTHKGIVYMDPTDLTKKCNAAKAARNVNSYGTPTGITSGCMKFYIYDDSGSTYKMILDHNITASIPWILEEEFIAAGGTSEEYGNWDFSNISTMLEPEAMNAQFATDTTGWAGNPRLITADEIAHIVGADTILGFDSAKKYVEIGDLEVGETIDAATQVSWFYLDGTGSTYDEWQDGPFANWENKSRYAWLYDYTYGCEQQGCNVEDNNLYENWYAEGYWTSTSAINEYGVQIKYELGYSSIYPDFVMVAWGIRPVISFPKEYIGDYVPSEDDSQIGNFGGTIVLEDSNSENTYKGIVYIDPTDLSATCNAQLAAQNLNNNDTPTGITSGCMKFYIYDDSGVFYKLILDHNTTNNVEWTSYSDFIAAGGTEAPPGEDGPLADASAGLDPGRAGRDRPRPEGIRPAGA